METISEIRSLYNGHFETFLSYFTTVYVYMTAFDSTIKPES